MRISLSNYTDNIYNLYYVDGKGSLITFKPIRKQVFYFLLLLLLVGTYWFLAMKSNEYVVFAVMGGFALLVYLLAIIYQSTKYLKWKKTVEDYVNGLKKFHTSEILVYDNSFELKSTSESLFEKWDDLKEVKFFEDHISFLNGSGSAYIFPAESMTKQEFHSLCEFIKDKIK